MIVAVIVTPLCPNFKEILNFHHLYNDKNYKNSLILSKNRIS